MLPFSTLSSNRALVQRSGAEPDHIVVGGAGVISPGLHPTLNRRGSEQLANQFQRRRLCAIAGAFVSKPEPN
jgi:hypothetical protein